jgi:hypothetical protein
MTTLTMPLETMKTLQTMAARTRAELGALPALPALPEMPSRPQLAPIAADMRSAGPGMLRRLGRLLVGVTLIGEAAGLGLALWRKRNIVQTTDPMSDEVTLAGVFGEPRFASTATAFQGGTVSCLFGGGTLDLRGAQLAPTGATLKVEAFNGGGQIIVPAEWAVESQVKGFFGGVGDGRPVVERPAEAPRLRIEGWALFGGFGITAGDIQDGPDRVE